MKRSRQSIGFGNPPVLSAPLERYGDLALTSPPSASVLSSNMTHGATVSGADLMPFQYMSLPPTHSLRDDIQGTCRSYEHDLSTGNIMMDCFVNPNVLSNPQANSDLIDVRSNVSKLHRLPEFLNPEVTTRQLIDGTNVNAKDHFMNGGVFSTDYQQPEASMTFMPVGSEVGTFHPMTTQRGEWKAGNISTSQISGPFSNLGSSPSISQHGESFVKFSSPRKVDGSFLTLGTGANPETRFDRKFSSQQIATALDEVHSSNHKCHAIQPTQNQQIITGRDASFQTNAGGSSNSSCNLRGQFSLCNDVGNNRGHNTGTNSLPFHTSLPLQAFKHPNHSLNGGRDSGFEVDMTLTSMPFGNSFIAHPECSRLSALASESNKPTVSHKPLIHNQQQNCYMENSSRVSSESSMNMHCLWNQGRPIKHAQLGNIVPLSGHIVEGGPIPKGVQPVEGRASEVVNPSPTSIQPVGQTPSCRNISNAGLGYGTIPERSGSQLLRSSTSHSGVGGPFPKRLGVQPNDLAATRAAQGDLPAVQNFQPVHYYPKPVGHPIAMGPPQVSLPPHANPCRLTGGTGQAHLPTQFPKEFPKADNPKGQIVPVANIDLRSQAKNALCQPSLKRGIENPAASPPLVQRRKVVHHQPVKYRPKYIPPAAALHIKWQGMEEPPKPTGQKCFLCKRDLSFAPEGPIHQPAVSPAVAVLPCGHAFHDQCLQNITPQDQAKFPCCIPCAIAEN